MPLPCLQRESRLTNFLTSLGNSFGSMNERLVRGESNTNVPFPSQNSSELLLQPSNSVNSLSGQNSLSSFFNKPSNSFSESNPGNQNAPSKPTLPAPFVSSTSGMLNSIKKVAETEK
jgi:hypothetical protein